MAGWYLDLGKNSPVAFEDMIPALSGGIVIFIGGIFPRLSSCRPKCVSDFPVIAEEKICRLQHNHPNPGKKKLLHNNNVVPLIR